MSYVNRYKIDKDRYKELEYFCYQYKKLSQAERDLINEVAGQAEPSIKDFLVMGVKEEGITPEILTSLKDMPCGRGFYYDRRRYFFFLLDKAKKSFLNQNNAK